MINQLERSYTVNNNAVVSEEKDGFAADLLPQEDMYGRAYVE